MERMAEWKSEKYIVTPRKKLADWGWRILMVGISIEVIIAVIWTAQGWAENPLNAPVSNLSAVVSFRVEEENFSENPIFGNGDRVASVMCCESNLVLAGKEIVLMSKLYPLDAAVFERYGDGAQRQYVLHFDLTKDIASFDPLDKNLSKETVGWALNNIHVLDIPTKFLPPNAKIIDGSAVLKINDRLKWFNIPAQTDSNPNAGKSGFGYVVVAVDDNSKKVDKKTMPGLLTE